jgi:hypothetical protein
VHVIRSDPHQNFAGLVEVAPPAIFGGLPLLEADLRYVCMNALRTSYLHVKMCIRCISECMIDLVSSQRQATNNILHLIK